MIPVEALPPRTAAVTMAVVRGAATIREVASVTGYSISNTHEALREARHYGLVSWTDFRSRTLRPLVDVVANTPREESCLKM